MLSASRFVLAPSRQARAVVACSAPKGVWHSATTTNNDHCHGDDDSQHAAYKQSKEKHRDEKWYPRAPCSSNWNFKLFFDILLFILLAVYCSFWDFFLHAVLISWFHKQTEWRAAMCDNEWMNGGVSCVLWNTPGSTSLEEKVGAERRGHFGAWVDWLRHWLAVVESALIESRNCCFKNIFAFFVTIIEFWILNEHRCSPMEAHRNSAGSAGIVGTVCGENWRKEDKVKSLGLVI